jgi:hypothetical protein
MDRLFVDMPRVVRALSAFACTTSALVLPTAMFLLAGPASARWSRSGPPPACGTSEFRQFDFFAGDWDTYEVADSTRTVARNQVTVILDGCVLREVYRQQDGLVGESFSLYDAARGKWHQSWVTNKGTLLLLEGGLEGDRMVLTGTEKAQDGTSSLLRGIWRRDGSGVRETAERSTDGGKTWKAVFDILFRKHRRQGTS